MMQNQMLDPSMIVSLRQAQAELDERTMSRTSAAITEYEDQFMLDEQNELVQLVTNNSEKKKKDRLDFFTKDSDYYTSLLLMIVKMQSDADLPPEIVNTLEPVREKC